MIYIPVVGWGCQCRLLKNNIMKRIHPFVSGSRHHLTSSQLQTWWRSQLLDSSQSLEPDFPATLCRCSKLAIRPSDFFGVKYSNGFWSIMVKWVHWKPSITTLEAPPHTFPSQTYTNPLIVHVVFTNSRETIEVSPTDQAKGWVAPVLLVPVLCQHSPPGSGTPFCSAIRRCVSRFQKLSEKDVAKKTATSTFPFVNWRRIFKWFIFQCHASLTERNRNILKKSITWSQSMIPLHHWTWEWRSITVIP